MAAKKFKTKKLNLKDHRLRLHASQGRESTQLSWLVALAALATAALLFYFQR